MAMSGNFLKETILVFAWRLRKIPPSMANHGYILAKTSGVTWIQTAISPECAALLGYTITVTLSSMFNNFHVRIEKAVDFGLFQLPNESHAVLEMV